jgi:hypothetical protein
MLDLCANEEIHDEIHDALYKLAHIDYTKPIIRNGEFLFGFVVAHSVAFFCSFGCPV